MAGVDEQDTSPMVAIRTQADFGALLERAMENEATQTAAEPAGGVDAAALLQDFSSPWVFSTVMPLLSVPTREAPSLPANAKASGAAGAREATAALGKKKKKGPQKGKQGRINRAAHKSIFRREKRAEERKICTPFEFKLKVRMAQRHGAPEPIRVDCRASEFRVNQNTYTAQPQAKIGKVPFSLQDLKKIRLKIVPWDGKIPMSALDIIETEMGYFVGQPQAPDWKQVILDAAEALEQVRVDSGFRPGQGKEGERGHFVAFSAGVTHSPQSNIQASAELREENMLTTRPQGPRYRENKPKEQEIIDRLLATPSIQRIATFGSRSLAYCAPKVYQHYAENLQPIYDDYGLKLLFQDSIFPSANFNLGPETACRIHVDCQNCPYGFCTITALGNYDPKKGGHLILWDFGFTIEFPPSSTILIPSACVRHGNVAIQPGEQRYSFTQYCPGPLIQWHRCGNRNVGELTAEEIIEIDGPKGARREKCRGLFSKYNELAEDQQKVWGRL
ncbi:hypothetical protein EWM64_g6968 [Hericium alpestre]|uniref:Uncharacterized protein n=1 Tax=Hericium alpestre TaxID=135208 RepID=A0A4Y9ZRZ4_9AGAM|nr:hypothetical protein EWM64_g6968 [Hericium alpestre]